MATIDELDAGVVEVRDQLGAFATAIGLLASGAGAASHLAAMTGVLVSVGVALAVASVLASVLWMRTKLRGPRPTAPADTEGAGSGLPCRGCELHNRLGSIALDFARRAARISLTPIPAGERPPNGAPAAREAAESAVLKTQSALAASSSSDVEIQILVRSRRSLRTRPIWPEAPDTQQMTLPDKGYLGTCLGAGDHGRTVDRDAWSVLCSSFPDIAQLDRMGYRALSAARIESAPSYQTVGLLLALSRDQSFGEAERNHLESLADSLGLIWSYLAAQPVSHAA